mmetsp:Transcript_113810/g.302458  ORF Transcript_113810/g.302458 Transcript_113810/m.302458 type:complete len:307 (-) Transcript_113810:860-1780(-)
MLVQVCLVSRVASRGALVHKGQLQVLLDKSPHKANALLLARGQEAPPLFAVGEGVMVQEVGKVHLLQGVLQPGILNSVPLHLGVKKLLTESAQDHVGLLRQEEDRPGRLCIDSAAAIGPEASHRPQQRALPDAARPGDHEGLAALQLKRQAINERLLHATSPWRGPQRHAPQLQRHPAPLRKLRGGGDAAAVGASHAEGGLQLLKAPHADEESGNIADLGHHKRQGAEDHAERHADLGDRTKLNLPAQVSRADHQRHNREGRQAIASVERVQAREDHDSPPDRRLQGGKGPLEAQPLRPAAIEEGH